MNTSAVTLRYETYQNIQELSKTDQMLCKNAEQALRTSHSPYSNFKVGTAVLLGNAQVVLGSNQENIAYPSGLCAERVALFHIGCNYPNETIKTIAITAFTEKFDIKNPITSCGACLQVMIEAERRQKAPIEVIFYCLNGQIIKVKDVKTLLPFAFVEDRLAK